MLPAPAPVVVVQHDDGGLIASFERRVLAYAKRGTRVRIAGPCYSACTLVLQLHGMVCVDGEAAELGFHQAYTPRDPKHIGPDDVFNRDESTTQQMLDVYPAPVRAWIDWHGGLTAELIVLRGSELRELVPSCR